MGRRRRVAVARAVDKISSLPDAILSGILSLIPTKEAVATSILSKRWIHLWKSVDNINLSEVKVNDAVSSYKFNEFMYSVLVSHVAAGSNFINSFDLNITYDETALASSTFHNITKWIDLVVQRRLKHLSLQIHMCDIGCPDVEEDNHFKLPISIFTCKTLVSLDLCSFRVEGFCFSSIGFGFPSLKTLHLIDIRFHQDRDFMLLLAGCPNLEDLLASFIDIQDSGTNSPAIHQEFKTLSLPKLTRAVIIIDDECECYFPVNALSNSEYLRIYTLKLYTQGLQFYEVSFIMNMMLATSIYVLTSTLNVEVVLVSPAHLVTFDNSVFLNY
jgi:hypothetical protein